ncbi:MAG: 3-dehydroquinate synthase [Desulfococcaceae bacterium]|jgi:3-dehydroquinate synthase|nr:3-dehydroquinate synthase [Desulfococcaceae bacterium]
MMEKKAFLPGRSYEQSFAVPFAYPVHFQRDIFSADNPLLCNVLNRLHENRLHRAIVCVDEGVSDAHPDLISKIRAYFDRYAGKTELKASPLCIPGGEKAKQWDTVRGLIREIGEMHPDRQSYVIAAGGGAVLDAVGFAAALIHRGLRLIRIPTTTLAQNDAGIGVKNGINDLDQKNFIGTFAPPFAVLNDALFLRSLDFDHWIAGIAEAFKVALIKDADFFDYLLAHAADFRERALNLMEESVYRCAVLHLDHIRDNGDPFEFGSARPLDFGHWAAHKLESMSGYRVGHGQAVSIGICMDACAAKKKGLLSEKEVRQILKGFTDCGLPVWHPLLEKTGKGGEPEILEGIENFREHLGGQLTLTLPDGIGKKTEVHHMEEAYVKESIAFLREFSSQKAD